MENVKLNSDRWVELTGFTILDPDGWDRSNFNESWAEEITFDEFYKRSTISTTMNRPRMDYDELKAMVFDKFLQKR